MTNQSVAFETVTSLDFDAAVESCRKALAGEGFGVLTEIDIQETLRAKLGVKRGPFLILGACHPPSAHRVLEAAPAAGVLLPCNVTVSREQGRTVVRAMNPAAVMEQLADSSIEEIGNEVGAALERVLRSLPTR